MSAGTKTVPCTHSGCGVAVEVHVYAANKLVKCPAHKGLSFASKLKGRKSVLDPLETGITPEERLDRLVGAVLTLRRRVSRVTWEEVVSVTGLVAYDEETGRLEVWAVGGGALPKFDAHRECGQYVAIDREEVVAYR